MLPYYRKGWKMFSKELNCSKIVLHNLNTWINTIVSDLSDIRHIW